MCKFWFAVVARVRCRYCWKVASPEYAEIKKSSVEAFKVFEDSEVSSFLLKNHHCYGDWSSLGSKSYRELFADIADRIWDMRWFLWGVNIFRGSKLNAICTRGGRLRRSLEDSGSWFWLGQGWARWQHEVQPWEIRPDLLMHRKETEAPNQGWQQFFDLKLIWI